MSEVHPRQTARVGTPTRQAAGYAGASIAVRVIGGLLAIVLARNLTTEQFGTYAFASTLLPLVALFCEFGLFLPAARRAALADIGTRHEIVGAALLAYLPVGLVCSAAVFGLSFVVDPVFHIAVGTPLRLVAPLAFVYPFPFVALQLVQGVERLHLYSILSVLERVVFLALILAVVIFTGHLTVGLLLVLDASTLLAGSLVLVGWLKPSARAARQWVTALTRDAREYGLHVFLGRVLSSGTYSMDILMVATFTNARSTGFYAIAGSIAEVVGLPAMALATALFSRLASQQRLDRGSLLATIALGAMATAGAVVLVTPFVHSVIGIQYRPVILLVFILAPAAAIRGVTSLYNTFLAAHGRGRELRNAALVLTTANLVANFALIPRFGAAGAAWASLVALIANLVAHLAWYRKSLLGQSVGVHNEMSVV